MRIFINKFSTLLIILLTMSFDAVATNGYFQHGYGSRSAAMAGASTALPLDSLGAAINPALMTHVGRRRDIELQLFSPMREAKSGFLGGSLAAAGQPAYSSESNSTLFAIPSVGYTHPLNDDTVLGISIYGNGGMNTDYPAEHTDPFFGTANQGIPCATNKTNLLGGCTDLGVDFSQLIFAPTLARKINQKHTLGASLLVGYQRFRAEGLHAFQSISAFPNEVTNKGYDEAFGYGLRIGWFGQITSDLNVGAAYSSKIYMGELDKYRGLLAEQGDLDIPANATIGVAFKANPKTTLTADIQWIGYSDVKSMANPGPPLTGGSPFPDSPSENQLGRNNGLGFGWDDMIIFKIGMMYQPTSQWTLRGGISYGEQPISNDQLAFNILATAVPETHLTLGFSYRSTKSNEWSFTYMHAFSNTEQGDFPEAFCTQGLSDCPYDTEIKMYQNSLSLGYSTEF